MSPVSLYLKTNNIPWHPVASELGLVGAWISTRLLRISPLAAKALFCVGKITEMTIGTIEMVATAALATIALLFHSILNHSEFWQKQAVLLYSYSLHSLLLVKKNFSLMLNGVIQSYTETLYTHLALQFQSALLVQMHIAPRLDREAGREPIRPNDRFRYLVWDMRPWACRDLQTAIFREGGIESGRQLFERMIGRAELPSIRVDNREAGMNYPERLARRIEEAFLEIYRTEKLWRRLDWGEEEGRSQLIDLDAQAIPPLCALAQLKELLMPINCPNRTRSVKLTQAKETIQELSSEEIEDLKQRLISTEGGRDDLVRSAFQQISALAGELHQGQLSIALNMGCENARDKIGI